MKKILLALILTIICTPVFAWQEIVQSDPYLYSFASSPTTTKTVKSSSGYLHTLTVTGGTASNIQIYDGAAVTANLLASFTSTNTIATYIFDVFFTSGCTVVTGGALQYTVSYK